MEKEDLIKQLENIELPEIEIQSHQRRLRLALLSSGYFKEKKIMNLFMFWTKRLVPAGVTLALILVVGFSVIQPKLQIARAMEIAKNDPQIQQLMKDYGVEIKEVKLQDGKAYVLLTLPEEKVPQVLNLERETPEGEPEGESVKVQSGYCFITHKDPKTGEVRESSGSIAEIDLKAKKVEKLEMIEETKIDITPLTEEEKARAIEIAKSDPKIKEMLPRDAEVKAVKPLPPLKLKIQTISEENGVRVVAYDEREDRRVNVIFESERGQDIITVNLSTGAIEGAMSTGKIERQESEYPVPEYPVPIKPGETLFDDVDVLPDEGEIKIDEKNLFVEILHNIAEKGDDRIKDLLKNNDYKILEVIKSKPVVEKTETSEIIRVETTTVVLEKESTGEKYWITIDMKSMTVKSIEKE